MFILNDKHTFPPIELASKDGMLAIGSDVHPDRLHVAYKNGIFPWNKEGEPILWYSPDPRMVLYPKDIYISKTMRKIIRKRLFTVTFNQNFEQVIRHCKTIERKGQKGTWLTDELEESMIQLHKKGIAKSVEVWQNHDSTQGSRKLVGGLYGLDLGTIFCGDSMFSLVSNASKLAFIYLAQKLEREKYSIIDCQVYNSHLASLGAVEISRAEFKQYLPL